MAFLRCPYAVQQQVVDLREASHQAVERGDPRAGSDKEVAGAGALGRIRNEQSVRTLDNKGISRLAARQCRGNEPPGYFPDQHLEELVPTPGVNRIFASGD